MNIHGLPIKKLHFFSFCLVCLFISPYTKDQYLARKLKYVENSGTDDVRNNEEIIFACVSYIKNLVNITAENQFYAILEDFK